MNEGNKYLYEKRAVAHGFEIRLNEINERSICVQACLSDISPPINETTQTDIPLVIQKIVQTDISLGAHKTIQTETTNLVEERTQTIE